MPDDRSIFEKNFRVFDLMTAKNKPIRVLNRQPAITFVWFSPVVFVPIRYRYNKT